MFIYSLGPRKKHKRYLRGLCIYIYIYIRFLCRFLCDARIGPQFYPWIWLGEDHSLAQQRQSGLRKCAAEISTPPPLGTCEALEQLDVQKKGAGCLLKVKVELNVAQHF